LKFAERLHTTLRSIDIAVQLDALRITASFGVTMLRPNDEDPEQILHRADAALYAAKAAGRDQVVIV
jgi:diguanylate cyclase (GGDEF)-like protein